MHPVLNLTDITLERQNRTILRHINWQIHSGEQWVVMGLNGSGKTSLLTVVCGYEWPTQGQVEVLGHRYGTVDLRELRKRIGWVSHHLAEWMSRDHGHVSVKDLVAGGRQAVIGKGRGRGGEESVEAVLTQFDLQKRAHSTFATLSQGEKTRVLLARAWTADVSLLILDEPCSGLDIAGREHLLGFVQHYLRRQDPVVPVVYVTHHPEEILPEFTHALVLKDGTVFAAGTADEIFDDRVLSDAFDVPLRILRSDTGRFSVQVQSPAQIGLSRSE